MNVINFSRKYFIRSSIDINSRLVIVLPNREILSKIEKWGEKNLSEREQAGLTLCLCGRKNYFFERPMCCQFCASDPYHVWLGDVKGISWYNNYYENDKRKLTTYIVLYLSSISYVEKEY